MKKYIQATILLSLILITGCNKFLEEKSDKRLSVPTTVEDFQALLNSSGNLNVNFVAAGEVSSDDYYLADADFNALSYESDKRLYTWQPNYVTRPQSSGGDEWYNCYKSIYICNSVLQGLEENHLTGSAADNVKGQALVFRAARYLDGVQIWAPAYSKQTANTDLGMVLRLDPDMNLPSVRSSVQQTYDIIIKDLTEAIALLPSVQISVTLPGKAAAHGLLARTYLFMGEYEKALQHAEESLTNTDAQVIDFNTLDPHANFPIPAVKEVSPEMIFWTGLFYGNHIRQARAKMTMDLYNLYGARDLRKAIYFKKNTDDSFAFKGNLFGYFALTNSLTPSEMLLIIAECNARLGNLPDAAKALNQLAIKRYETDNFTSFSFNDKEDALRTALEERRKELVMRGLRWADIKRLNRDGYNITLTRIVNGETYTLPPNDLRFAIAISEDVIEIGEIQQNPR